MRRAICWVAAPLLIGAGANAQERPGEDELFGGAPGAATATTTTTTTATVTERGREVGPEPTEGRDGRDELNLSNPRAATRFSDTVAPEDPLKIGGHVYWRAMGAAGQGQQPQNWALSTPALLDIYVDARPNERVRAFALGRMFYNPTLPSGESAGTSTTATGASAQSSDSTSVSLLSQQATRGPSALLDQIWVRFDVLRRVFVTAGKQHVRWGTARFWTPTDYLHLQPRNPLVPFDARSGVTMLKLHVPWEERGWNFYAYAVPEDAGATATMRRVAAAARAEVVFGAFEVGAGVFGRADNKAKLAGDVSFGVWDLDFYGELAVRNAADIDFVHYKSDASTCTSSDGTALSKGIADYYSVARGSGWKPQATGGVSYTRKYADKDILIVGAEYFYNGLGYASVKEYLGLFAFAPTMANPASFFYLGRQYLGVFVSAPSPYSWDLHSFTLSSLANLTDQSGITRLDYAYTLLTHIRFEAYAAAHWGQRNGEFRLGFDSAALPCLPQGSVPSRPPSLFDVGVGLRVTL